jgi:hypothetical protein
MAERSRHGNNRGRRNRLALGLINTKKGPSGVIVRDGLQVAEMDATEVQRSVAVHSTVWHRSTRVVFDFSGRSLHFSIRFSHTYAGTSVKPGNVFAFPQCFLDGCDY